MLEIIKEGDWTVPQALIIEKSLEGLEQGITKLPNDILTMPGMSGIKYRSFINKLVELTPDARYLEIGSWKGSTACSAAYGNNVKVTCIDNWYQGDSVKNTFLTNIAKFMTEQAKFFYEQNNFYKVDYHSIGKYNVYMFDGPHEKEDQFAGIKLVQPALDDVFTLIVDDYNDKPIQEGTQEAIEKINLKVLSSLTILTGENPYLKATDWHNGYYIAVIQKG